MTGGKWDALELISAALKNKHVVTAKKSDSKAR